MTSRTTSFSLAPSPIASAVEEASDWAALIAAVRSDAVFGSIAVLAPDVPEVRVTEAPSRALPGAAVAAPDCTPTTTIAATAARAAARRVFMWGVMRSPLFVPWGVTSGERATA